jgi:dTDP-4-amino-4,6-dideoxygalactose transaminase
MNIPFLDLKAQYHSLRGEIDSAVQRVLEHGSFILGEEVAAFENEFAIYSGARYAVGVASGTEALQLALSACEIKKGEEVITSAHTSVATIAAIEMAGARPILVDIDPQRYTMNPKLVSAAVSGRTRVLLPVHVYGCPADLSPLLEMAQTNNLSVVEDCAQAHGARYRGKHVGRFGQIGAFSFYPTKNLGAYGDGGAVITDDPAVGQHIRRLRQYGWGEDRVSGVKGINSRLDELQAAILRVKLKHLETWNARRSELASLYRTLLAESKVGLPPDPVECAPVHHLFVIRCEKRDALRAFLSERGIQTLVHYPVPVHLQPAYANLGYRKGDFPETELASREVLSLPLYPEMTDESVGVVSRAILDFFNGMQN